jgi:metallophosphoesterase superfamily enzyme
MAKVLVISDLHCPWDHPDYLDHCKKVYKKWKCDTVVFIGDVVDFASLSYHEKNPDMPGPADEVRMAIERLSKWYKVFPKATVIYGNHCLNYARKMFTAGIPSMFKKELGEVLMVPNWNFVDSIIIDEVYYSHGLGMNSTARVKSQFQSCVSGHYHSLCYIQFFEGYDKTLFALQTGIGIDQKAEAFKYGKWGKRGTVACSVIVNGTHPYIIPIKND